MVHSHTFKYALLALGLCATVGACGGDSTADMGTTITYSANIQKDMVALSCIAAGCHDATGTSPATNLKINVQGDMMANYMVLLTNNYVVKGNAATSPLIKVPSTGVAISGASHVKTLSGTKLTDWTTWINNQAPF